MYYKIKLYENDSTILLDCMDWVNGVHRLVDVYNGNMTDETFNTAEEVEKTIKKKYDLIEKGIYLKDLLTK